MHAYEREIRRKRDSNAENFSRFTEGCGGVGGGGELVVLMQWKEERGKLFRYYSRVPVVNLLTLYFRLVE